MIESLENRLLFAFGQTDTSFGTAGRVKINFTAENATPVIQKVLVDSDKRILAGGSDSLVRMSAAGALDVGFGDNGQVTFPAGIGFRDEAIDPTDGKIYVLFSGSTGTGLFRYTTAGGIDSSYGQDGTVRVTSSTSFTPQSLAMQSNGDVLVAGVFKTDGDNGREIRVYRLKTDGTTDTSFGSSGSKEFNFGTGSFVSPDVRDNIAGIAVLSSGKILIGGSTADLAPSTGDPEFTHPVYDKAQLAVARLNTNGQLDTTYAGNGIALTEYANADQVNLAGILTTEEGAFAVRSDGSALVAATADQAVIEELNPSGKLKYETEAASGSQLNTVMSISILNDGRSVLLTRPRDLDYEGFSFAYVTTTGVLGNVVFTSENGNANNDLDSDIEVDTAVNSNSELLVGGAGLFQGSDFDYEIAEYKIGKTTDPRPDDFPNARANDIVKDLTGGLHIAFYDASTTHLMYAYRAPNGLWNAPVTVDSDPDAGQYVSIAVNSKLQPGIAYFDGNTGDLKVAQFNGKKWIIQDVDSKGSVGLYPSFTYDSADEPVVTYYNKTKGKLTFALQNSKTGKWGYENVDASGDNVGRSSDLIVSRFTGRYTVAYVDNTTGSVMWAERQKGGTWQTKVAATTRGGADFLSMAYGEDENDYQPAISYYDAYASDLKVTYYDYENGVFTVKTIATSGAQGLYTQLAFGPQFEDPVIFSYSKSADKITFFSGNTITGTPMATDIVTSGGKYLSVEYNGTTTDLAYFDATVNGIIVRPGPTLTDLS